jgi:hypothetical protein
VDTLIKVALAEADMLTGKEVVLLTGDPMVRKFPA